MLVLADGSTLWHKDVRATKATTNSAGIRELSQASLHPLVLSSQLQDNIFFKESNAALIIGLK